MVGSSAFRHFALVVFYIFSILAAGAVFAEFGGCAPVRDTTCARVFRDELLECVEKAKTREESQLCRELVELRWGYPHE